LSALAPDNVPSRVDVILRDGATLRLRAPTDADAGALGAFFDGLSDESLYQRFHGTRRVDARLLARWLEGEGADRRVLVGTMSGDRIVALAEYERLRDPSVAEVAFAVADELQGRGIGTRLLEQLAARAGADGIERFVAEVLPANRPMLSLFEEAGFEITRELDGGEVEVRFPIAPTERYRSRVDERDHLAVTNSLRPFFEPAAVAVIGASRRRGSIGGELFRNILEAGFTGTAYPVNRDGAPVGGVAAYRSAGDIPGPVDLAVICLAGPHVLGAAEGALGAGVRALCVISSGFAETGEQGRDRQERLLALVRAHGGRLVGPNCLGIAVPGLGLNATFGPRPLPLGPIAFSSQSGALGLAMLEKAAERNLGFSAFVSIGNKADVSSNDLLEWWEDDPSTDLVLLYLESFGNPEKFGRLARRVARRKPLLALKAGATQTGARAASSHTAALAGSDAAVAALFRQSGVTRAGTLEELVDAATLLSRQPLPQGRRVGVVTNAGGLGILCADACEAAGLELPELSKEVREALTPLVPADASLANPVDLLGSATGATYEAVIPQLLAEKRLDALIVLFVPPVVAGAEEVATAVDTAVATAASEKPVLAVIVSGEGVPAALRESGSSVAAFSYPESAARALGLAAERGEWLRRPAGSVPAIEIPDAAAARAVVTRALEEDGDGWLSPERIRTLLGAFGIPLVEERVATGADEAVTAAAELGYPVVVKTAAAGAHKTERGGVAVDLRDEAQVRAAVGRIGAPVLVQPLVSGSAELLAGLVQDPVFGPLVAFGPGGVFAELIGDAAFRIAPITDVDAQELVREGKAGRLIAGFRGAAPADAAALTDLVQRLSLLAVSLPEVAELDLNPVIALSQGCVAVDARARISPRRPERPLKGW
jgi:acyl-CoA synthetase (NDP forming)/RimJ/RimL family protein N-acetyltransferase